MPAQVSACGPVGGLPFVHRPLNAGADELISDENLAQDFLRASTSLSAPASLACCAKTAEVPCAAPCTRTQLTPYNEFLRVEMKRIMAANPEMSHKEAFKNAVEKWAATKTRCCA